MAGLQGERLASSSRSGRDFRSICAERPNVRGENMLVGILILILILALVGAVPTWPHSKSWGYYPTGGIGLALAVVLILVFVGVI
jgi:hypothetical protein